MSFNSMSPWDSNAYFDAPVERNVALTGTQVLKVVKPNPRRVALRFANPSGNIIYLSTRPDLQTAQGMQLTANAFLPVDWLHSEFGPFCTLSWYALCSISTALTVFELLLNEWPRRADELEAMIHANESRPLQR